jgi:hypothetical protein
MTDMVTVFEPTSPGDRMLAEAALEHAGITFVAKNSEIQDLFGAGQIGGFNLATGGVQLQVALEDEETARQVISEFREPTEADGDIDELQPDPREPTVVVSEQARLVARYSQISVVWAVLWLGGVGSLLAVVFACKALLAARDSEDYGTGKAWFGLSAGLLGLVVWGYVWGLPLIL